MGDNEIQRTISKTVFFFARDITIDAYSNPMINIETC